MVQCVNSVRVFFIKFEICIVFGVFHVFLCPGIGCENQSINENRNGNLSRKQCDSVYRVFNGFGCVSGSEWIGLSNNRDSLQPERGRNRITRSTAATKPRMMFRGATMGRNEGGMFLIRIDFNEGSNLPFDQHQETRCDRCLIHQLKRFIKEVDIQQQHQELVLPTVPERLSGRAALRRGR
nr:uncharacterized protein LOC115256391 isoform X2 [Aedes albopictus]